MSELWYFTCEGKQMEPVTTSELKQLGSSGFLRGADMVWQEGMPTWVKAESIPGLIPPTAALSAAATMEPAPVTATQRKPSSDAAAIEPQIQRRRRVVVDDDFDDDEFDRPIRRRREPAKGMSGLALGLIIGGVGLVVLVALGAIVFVSAARRPAGNRQPPFAVQPKIKVAPGNPPGRRFGKQPPFANAPIFGPVNIEAVGAVVANAPWKKEFTFPVAKVIEVRVNSDVPANDIDLFIFDQDGQEVVRDDLPFHVCQTQFKAEPNRRYRFEIHNLGNSPSNCTLTYTQP